MKSIALSTGTVVEIISAYAATNQQLPAEPAAPAWVVIGGFYMPADSPTRLEVVGSIGGGATSLAVRLFDVAGAAPVSGSQTTDLTSATDVRALSGAFDLAGGKVYQVQAQCIGPSGFALVRSAQPISS